MPIWFKRNNRPHKNNANILKKNMAVFWVSRRLRICKNITNKLKKKKLKWSKSKNSLNSSPSHLWQRLHGNHRPKNSFHWERNGKPTKWSKSNNSPNSSPGHMWRRSHGNHQNQVLSFLFYSCFRVLSHAKHSVVNHNGLTKIYKSSTIKYSKEHFYCF